MHLVLGFSLLGQDDGVLKQEQSAMVLVELHQHQVSLTQDLAMLSHVALWGGRGQVRDKGLFTTAVMLPWFRDKVVFMLLCEGMEYA